MGPSNPPAITLMCPAAQTMTSASGLPIAVTYASPTAAGGTAPITTTCTPPSGVNYPIGSTPVWCNAVDAKQQTASCSFSVTVTAPPRTSVTRYVAFGDSMSHGVLGLAPFAIGDPGPPVGYAFKFRTLLADRYTAQTFSVTDEGVAGETVAEGLERLPGVLTRDAPEVLLLLEGVNDLNGGQDAAIPAVVNGLRSMVGLARGKGIAVFLGTLLPQRPDGFRALAPGSIVPANIQIGDMARSEGAVLVDLYQAFDGHTDTLLGPDGLHPNDAGYQKMAETFFTAIRASLELPATVPRFRHGVELRSRGAGM